MNGKTRRYLEMGTRADEFSAAHPDTDAGYIVAAGRLTQLVEQARGQAAEQREGQIDVHAAAARKKDLRREMLLGPIAHLAEVGKLAAREDHELGKTFTFKPNAETYLAFRTAAGSMAAAAQGHKELLIKHGLSESVLAQFVQMLDQFDAAVTLGNSGRTAHIGATKNLDALATEIARTVRVMDARNRQRFQNDGQLLNSWISARTVLGKPRSVTTPKDGVTPSQDGTTSVTGEVRPAA
jgi:hypothetical protein